MKTCVQFYYTFFRNNVVCFSSHFSSKSVIQFAYLLCLSNMPEFKLLVQILLSHQKKITLTLCVCVFKTMVGTFYAACTITGHLCENSSFPSSNEKKFVRRINIFQLLLKFLFREGNKILYKS